MGNTDDLYLRVMLLGGCWDTFFFGGGNHSGATELHYSTGSSSGDVGAVSLHLFVDPLQPLVKAMRSVKPPV